MEVIRRKKCETAYCEHMVNIKTGNTKCSVCRQTAFKQCQYMVGETRCENKCLKKFCARHGHTLTSCEYIRANLSTCGRSCRISKTGGPNLCGQHNSKKVNTILEHATLLVEHAALGDDHENHEDYSLSHSPNLLIHTRPLMG